MPCFTPLKAYFKSGGGIAFDSKRGFADRPLELACGQCIGCRVRRSREWALRCVHEAQMHERNSFITLTYSPSKLPKDGGLVVRDWQLFAKRMRKRLGSFRFFACGEYGDSSNRPHYHACIFGLDFSADREVMKSGKYGNLYFSQTLEDLWTHGFASVGELNYSSAAYVARYVMKKITGDKADEHYQRYDSKTGEVWSVRPEFVVMSRRPGIGSAWFDKFMSEVYPGDEVILQGRHFRPPRYYDEKLDELALKELKAKRWSYVDKRELTDERLRAREEFEVLKSKSLKRGL